MSNTQTLTSEDFHATIDGEKPVLVDFWAEWCGPCRAVAPTLDEIADDRAASLVVGKLNVDEHSDIAQSYGVMSIPTMIIFKDGVEKKRLVGARSRDAIEAELAEFAF